MNKTILTTALALASSASLSQAAVISWDAVLTNTTASDIITTGTLHIAIDAASSDANTINGVTFAPGNPLGSNAEGTFWTAGSGVNTTGDLGLDNLLDSHSYQGGGGSFDLVGLSIGQAYDIQIISVGDTRTCCNTRLQMYGGGGSFSADLSRQDPSSVIGHFVADAATQTIDVTGATDPGLSGYQVRAVPEPSGLALLGLAGLVALRRRR